MTNLKLLETKIEERNSMMEFLINADELKFDDALKLNNEIALNSMKIKMMEKYPYSILQKDADDWYLEQNSKINETIQ